MKLKLMMRDQEYQNALAARLGRVCSEIYVEIGNDFSQDEDTLIITDIGRGRLGPGMVFLHKECIQEMEGCGPYTLFKYDSVGSLVRNLWECFYLWTGRGTLPVQSTSMVFVGAASRTDICHRFAESFAQQLSNHSDFSVLYLPLSYLLMGYRCTVDSGMEDFNNSIPDKTVFRKLVYYVQQGREIPRNLFFCRLHRNVFQLHTENGINPVATMGSEGRNDFIRKISSYFDIVILSAGDCYSQENLDLMMEANVRFFLIDNEMRAVFPPESYFIPENECGMAHVESMAGNFLNDVFR